MEEKTNSLGKQYGHQNIIIYYEVEKGEHIGDTIQKMIEIYLVHKCPVIAKHNGVPLRIDSAIEGVIVDFVKESGSANWKK